MTPPRPRAGTRFLPFALLFFGLRAPDAHAYLDPGTGSYLFQLVAAGILASLFTVKLYWQKLKDWVRARRAPPPTDPRP